MKLYFPGRDEIKEQSKRFGHGEGDTGGFDYDKAPPRGWQEGKKDFSHRVSVFLSI